MHARSEFVPTEEQQCEKARLEKKCVDAFEREWAAKNVADKARIMRPVRPEFELHRDTRRHADREDQPEDLGPEPRHVEVERVARLTPAGPA